MADLHFRTDVLLDNVSGSATGEYITTARSRNMLFTTYATGYTAVGYVFLQYPSPFTGLPPVTFQTITISGNGYSDSLYMDSPAPKIRAVTSGTCRFSVALTQQN